MTEEGQSCVKEYSGGTPSDRALPSQDDPGWKLGPLITVAPEINSEYFFILPWLSLYSYEFLET